MPPKAKSKVKSKTNKHEAFEFPNSFLNLSSTFSNQFFTPQPQVIVSNQIIVIEKLFTADLCNELIKAFSSKIQLEPTPVIKSRDYAARVNDRASLNDIASASKLWEYLKLILVQDIDYDDDDIHESKNVFKDAIGLNPQLRIYRYRRGHHFGKHYDDSVKCQVSERQNGITGWTLLIYLTGDDEFKGGGTVFYDHIKGAQPLNIHPRKGMALLHKHGDDCMLHEAEMVRDGEKWVLRSDVAF